MGGCGCKKKKTEAAVVTQTSSTQTVSAVNETTNQQATIQVQAIVDKIKEMGR
jgi:hypothetical protein